LNLRAPKTKVDIIVYKTSTPYDTQLIGNKFPFVLYQPPFNSTTYVPWFDFNSFLGSSQDICCLWEILIPKGSNVLEIAHPFQAYLTEREILLPYGCSFEVLGYENVDMSYYGTRETPIKVQQQPYYIGEVYRHDGWEPRPIKQRTMRMLKSIYRSPF
jgi:hypothetical protein